MRVADLKHHSRKQKLEIHGHEKTKENLHDLQMQHPNYPRTQIHEHTKILNYSSKRAHEILQIFQQNLQQFIKNRKNKFLEKIPDKKEVTNFFFNNSPNLIKSYRPALLPC